jgi:hypothetical protein
MTLPSPALHFAAPRLSFDLMIFAPCRSLLAAAFAAVIGCAAATEVRKEPAPSTPPATGVPSTSAPASTASVPTAGEIKPPPEGCLSLVFFAPGENPRALRNARGRIADVIAGNGRKEPVLARISRDEIEDLVPRIAEIIAGKDPEPISHIPSYYAMGHIPGPPAWEYLKRWLLPADEFWTYGQGETGLLVIRDGQLLCLMHIKVPFED